MKITTKTLFMIATGGILVGLSCIYIFGDHLKPQDPLAVSYNPYDSGIYATGIVESFQVNGSNINVYPEVSSRVTKIFVKNGDPIKMNESLIQLDSTVQVPIVEKDKATVQLARDKLVTVQEQYQKLKKAYDINPKSVSKFELDNSKNAVITAQQNIAVAQAQTDSDIALLEKYTIRSPIDGIVLRVVPSIGDYASSTLGSYDPYTQSSSPTIQLGEATPYLQVRVYVDEILTPRLPNTKNLEATLFVRGLNNHGIPITFVNLQPFTIPNIELSDEREERVDVRVLPIIFKFERPTDINIFPGQLVDVYIKGKP